MSLFNQFISKLVEKKAEFVMRRDAYNNLVVEVGKGYFDFTDMGDCVSVNAPNLFLKCKSVDELMFIYGGIKY